MRIMNQSRDAIYVLDTAADVRISHATPMDKYYFVEIKYPGDIHYSTLGSYKTEEKARRVLHEILLAKDYYEMPQI